MTKYVESIIGVGIILIVLGGVLCVPYSVITYSGYSSAELYCKESWRESGYEYKYIRSAGCLIKTKDGRWLPEHAIKESLE